MKLFAKIVNGFAESSLLCVWHGFYQLTILTKGSILDVWHGFHPLIIFAKSSILDVWHGSHPCKHSSWWRHLDDVLKSLLKKVSLSSEDVFKTSSRFLDQEKYIHLGHTSSRRLHNVFKTSSKRLQEVLPRRLQNVFRTSCKDVFKTFPRRIIKLSCPY